jgi:hypothetical protein
MKLGFLIEEVRNFTGYSDPEPGIVLVLAELKNDKLFLSNK